MNFKRILFVCTGNSCRSVMAQSLMQHLFKRAGVENVTVDSAGIFAMEGMGPTRETQRVLQEIGIDCSTHRAQAVRPDLVEAADLILVMEQFQLDEILARFPGTRGKVHLLKTYGLSSREREGHPNIPDPIGKPLEVYEICFADIREAVERVMKSLGVRAG